MRIVRGGNLSYARVGYTRPLLPLEEIPFGFVENGTVQVEVGRNDNRFTPAERAAGRARVKCIKFPGYPIPVLEDTTFIGTNFAQELPHTVGVFAIAPGVRVVFEAEVGWGPCQLRNVTIPAEVGADDIGDVNNTQTIEVMTGNREAPTIRVHAEDEATATFTAALQAEIASGRWAGHHRLGRVKEMARLRRMDPIVKEADLAAIVASNEAEVQKARTGVAASAPAEA